MEEPKAVIVYPHRYDMRVYQRKVFMYYLVQLLPQTSFSVQTDVKQKSLNLSNLLQQNIITLQIKSHLQSNAKKYQISTYKRQTFVSIKFLLEYIKQMKYKAWIVKAIQLIQSDLDNRTKMLALESVKRNKAFQIKNSIDMDDRSEQVKYLRSKLEYLFEKEYQIDTNESLDKLYHRVKSGSVLQLSGLKMSQYEEEKMKTIYNRYFGKFDKIAAYPCSSQPSTFRLPKQLTSLYIVHTDIETTLEGKTYNVIKVGKTDKSIFEYESSLYQDYKSKILFKHVYLGIFQKISGQADVDKYFHERLIMIPRSRYFIFNYHQAEEETRVAQEFYLLTDQFIEKMEQLLKDFMQTHKHWRSVVTGGEIF